MTTATAQSNAATPAESAAEIGARIEHLKAECRSIVSVYGVASGAMPSVTALENEIAALEARRDELAEDEAAAGCVETPPEPTFATLAAFRDHVESLRRATEALQAGAENIEQMHAALAAQKAALQDLAAAEAAALFERIKAGHDELADEQQRAFREQRGSIAGALRGMPVDLKELPALNRMVARQRAELCRQWAHARAEGRRLVREAIEADAQNALASIEDPRATVTELIGHFETARDLAGAHAAFYNSPAGREWLGNDIVLHPHGKSMAEESRWGVAGQLADALQLEAYHARLQGLAPGLSLEPDANAVERTLESFRAHFGDLAYGDEERRLERVCHVSVAGKQALRNFRADPAQFSPGHRASMERRVAEIEAAAQALEALRATAF